MTNQKRGQLLSRLEALARSKHFSSASLSYAAHDPNLPLINFAPPSTLAFTSRPVDMRTYYPPHHPHRPPLTPGLILPALDAFGGFLLIPDPGAATISLSSPLVTGMTSPASSRAASHF